MGKWRQVSGRAVCSVGRLLTSSFHASGSSPGHGHWRLRWLSCPALSRRGPGTPRRPTPLAHKGALGLEEWLPRLRSGRRLLGAVTQMEELASCPGTHRAGKEVARLQLLRLGAERSRQPARLPLTFPKCLVTSEAFSLDPSPRSGVHTPTSVGENGAKAWLNLSACWPSGEPAWGCSSQLPLQRTEPQPSVPGASVFLILDLMCLIFFSTRARNLLLAGKTAAAVRRERISRAVCCPVPLPRSVPPSRAAGEWGPIGVSFCSNLQLWALPRAEAGVCPVLRIGCLRVLNSTEAKDRT